MKPIPQNDSFVMAARTAAREAAREAAAVEHEFDLITQVFRITRSLLCPDSCLVTAIGPYRLVSPVQNDKGQITGWHALRGQSLTPGIMSDHHAGLLAVEHASLSGYHMFLNSAGDVKQPDGVLSDDDRRFMRQSWREMPLVDRHAWVVRSLDARLDGYRSSSLAVPDVVETTACINTLMVVHLPSLGVQVWGHRFLAMRPDGLWAVERSEDGQVFECALAQSAAFTLCRTFVEKRGRDLYAGDRKSFAKDAENDDDWRQLPLADREDWISKALDLVRKEACAPADAAMNAGCRPTFS